MAEDRKARPTFKDTADFFESRAANGICTAERKRILLEEAGFYRSLAAIVPRLPPDYKAPRANGNRWLDRAEVCRAIAEGVKDGECQSRLLTLADAFERMSARSGQ